MKYFKNPKLKWLIWNVFELNNEGNKITKNGLENMKHSLIKNEFLKEINLSSK
jgi:hypothetical protein